MEPRLWERPTAAFIFTCLLCTALSRDQDRDLKFCGTWRHAKGTLSVNVNLSEGCDGVVISADNGSLSIHGQITAHCRYTNVFQVTAEEESSFCLYWEPLLDQLNLQIREENLTLCWPTGRPDFCCSYLSHGPNSAESPYGIVNGVVRGDVITYKTLTSYEFSGSSVSCETLCHDGSQVNMIHSSAADDRVSCAVSSEVEMKEDFRGSNITSPAREGFPPEYVTSVHLPPALERAVKHGSKVVVTFLTDNLLFQESHQDSTILDDVVEITVENEIVTDLPEPIRIAFHHDVIPETHSRSCVSWDTRKDPMAVKWQVDGCRTQQRGSNDTDCLCNHLTYFTVLVQLRPRPVRHLLALTAITSLGCAASMISCVVLMVYLCRKRRYKDQSIPIHLGLAASLALLNLLFFFTGVVANVGGNSVCVFVAAGLHYALLSSFTWMGIEVFHTFWLVYMVFRPSPKPYFWYLVGFTLPAVPVIMLAAVGDIYGLRAVAQSNDESDPYFMCWMKDDFKARLAHYFTNMTILAVLVSAGVVMLFLVYREIRTRDEWRQNRVAFFSIWGLSCLFGTTWAFTFLDFGPLSDFILFLSCILNSFQGFLLMLRFFMLDWMRKQAGGSGLGNTSTGSTRQYKS